jgi:hypothetical protein
MTVVPDIVAATILGFLVLTTITGFASRKTG